MTEAAADIPAPSQENSARQTWMAVLARASEVELEQALADLESQPVYRFLRHPEIGLMMMRGRAGGSGQPFNLGETTVARASVKIVEGPAAGQVGHAYIRGRNLKLAEMAAVFDALLQAPDHTDILTARLIAPLRLRQEARKQARVAQSAPTKVDFFTMSRER